MHASVIVQRANDRGWKSVYSALFCCKHEQTTLQFRAVTKPGKSGDHLETLGVNSDVANQEKLGENAVN
jgi:hypothetical protein